MNHNGTLEDLQTIIKGCGFTVGEVKDQEHGHQIRTNEGAIVNCTPQQVRYKFKEKSQ